jgi:hypothetical protein
MSEIRVKFKLVSFDEEACHLYRFPAIMPTTMRQMDLVASMRTKRKVMKKTRTTMSDLFGTELLLFPFCCLDAKGGEESIYLVINLYVSFITFIWTCLVRT